MDHYQLTIFNDHFKLLQTSYLYLNPITHFFLTNKETQAEYKILKLHDKYFSLALQYF